jgi:hypothetical protein
VAGPRARQQSVPAPSSRTSLGQWAALGGTRLLLRLLGPWLPCVHKVERAPQAWAALSAGQPALAGKASRPPPARPCRRYMYWSNEDYQPTASTATPAPAQAPSAAALRRRPAAPAAGAGPVRAAAALPRSPPKLPSQQDIRAMLGSDDGTGAGAAAEQGAAAAPTSQPASPAATPPPAAAPSLATVSICNNAIRPQAARPSLRQLDEQSLRTSISSLPPDLSGFSFSVLPSSSPSQLRMSYLPPGQQADAGCIIGSALHQQLGRTASAAADAAGARAAGWLPGSAGADGSPRLSVDGGGGSGSGSSLQQLGQGGLQGAAPDEDLLQRKLLQLQEGSAGAAGAAAAAAGGEEEPAWYFGVGGGVSLRGWFRSLAQFVGSHPHLWTMLSVPFRVGACLVLLRRGAGWHDATISPKPLPIDQQQPTVKSLP